jgi:hypothetical protein
MRTLEEYFLDNFKNNIIDFSLRATPNLHGGFDFYIHPANVSGDTLDFIVKNNQLRTKNDTK